MLILNRPALVLDRTLKILLTLFVLWNAFNPLPALQERAIFLALVLLAFFSDRMANSNAGFGRKAPYWVLMLLTLISFGYVSIYHNDILFFSGMAPAYTTYLGIAAVAVLLAACLGAVGRGLTIIILLSVLYGLFGHHLPREFGGHSYFSLERIIGSIYLSTDGIFGDVTYTLLKYVFLFVLFGKLMEKLGALSFIIDFSQATVGRVRGGPAMVSTVASGLMGSVNGSAVANVMVTGTISIPLMKKAGFSSEFAGGVEAAASTGGQFLPPVMGATAFLIATFLGVSYLDVVRAALIPAVLYYVGILAAVYIYSVKQGVLAPPVDQLPKLANVIRDSNGLTFLTGIGLLVYMLIAGYSPIIAVLAACAAMILVSIFGKNRLTAKKALRVLHDTSEDFITIGVAGGSVGILVSMLLLTGLVLRFSGLIIDLVGANLIMVLLATALCSIIIGFGLPTIVTYIVLSIMAVPLLIELGVTPMAAHLFVFFTGMVGMVTPPVALAALAASSVAKSDFWKTGLISFRLALPALILPFFFVLDNSLLMSGTPWEIAIHTLYATVGVCLMSLSLTGSVRSLWEWVERALYFVAAILFIFPSAASSLTAVLLACIASVRPLRRRWTSRSGLKKTSWGNLRSPSE